MEDYNINNCIHHLYNQIGTLLELNTFRRYVISTAMIKYHKNGCSDLEDLIK